MRMLSNMPYIPTDLSYGRSNSCNGLESPFATPSPRKSCSKANKVFNVNDVARLSAPLIISSSSSPRKNARAMSVVIGPPAPLATPIPMTRKSCDASAVSHDAASAAASPTRSSKRRDPSRLSTSNILSTLGQSKVFQGRVEKSVTVIQKHVRRYLVRDILPQQKLILAQHIAVRRQWQAAVKIQSCIRRHRAQQMRRIRYLECKLHYIQQEQVHEMADIETWKRNQRRQIRKQFEKQEAKQKGVLHEFESAVEKLRKCNRKIRSQNEELEEACKSLFEVNQIIEKNLVKVNENIKFLQDYIDKMEAQTPKYQSMLDKLERRGQELEKAIAKHDEVLEYEATIAHIYRRYLAQVKECICESKRCDGEECENLLKLCEVA